LHSAVEEGGSQHRLAASGPSDAPCSVCPWAPWTSVKLVSIRGHSLVASHSIDFLRCVAHTSTPKATPSLSRARAASARRQTMQRLSMCLLCLPLVLLAVGCDKKADSDDEEGGGAKHAPAVSGFMLPGFETVKFDESVEADFVALIGKETV